MPGMLTCFCIGVIFIPIDFTWLHSGEKRIVRCVCVCVCCVCVLCVCVCVCVCVFV